MTIRIEVSPKYADTRARVKRDFLRNAGVGSGISSLELIDAYTLDFEPSATALTRIQRLLAEPSSENVSSTYTLAPKKFTYAIEIGFLPGVTDTVGATARESMRTLIDTPLNDDALVYTSQVHFITGKLTRDEAEKISLAMHNPLIERGQVVSFEEWHAHYEKKYVPKVQLGAVPKVTTVDLAIDDTQLQLIGKMGIENNDGTRRGPLALDMESLHTIRDYFKKEERNPTDIELESIAQTWSEHCKHTIFSDPLDDLVDGLYRTYIKGATKKIRSAKGKKDFCVSVFSDNAGAIVFDKDYLVTHKVETHNSPSALDPFGGAITGIVGVNRDTMGFGLGAKPVINLYGYCVADPRDTSKFFRDSQLQSPLLSARRILDGIVQGVNVGGNCSGIPTPQGFVLTHPRFRGKPLVFVGNVGLIPKKIGKKLAHEKQARPGDYILVCGGRVGQDGIHGATFSSVTLDSHSPATAVQIGDPITQKKMSDTLVKEARDRGLFTSITDNGAGGISCSVAEMAKECDGCEVDLDAVLLKYPGLSAWQIWISESQERMTLAVPKESLEELQKLLISRGVESAVIGTFTNSGRCVVTSHGEKIVDMSLEFLHNGRKAKHQISSIPQRTEMRRPVPTTKNLSKELLNILARPSIASTAYIARQYDAEVQGGSVLKPLQGKGQVNADTTITKPLLTSKKGVALSSGCLPTYTEHDAYKMAGAVVDTAIRGIVAAGGTLDTLAILDNCCWCKGNDPERLYQLKETIRGCHDYAVAYGTPFISGKDSMFNDFKGFDATGSPVAVSALPTMLISSIGVVSDVTRAVSIDAKSSGDVLYLIGETHDELQGSEYLGMISADADVSYATAVPQVDAKKNVRVYRALEKVISKELLASSISVSRGGFAVALSKMLIAGNLGARVDIKKIAGSATTDIQKFFAESQGRILVSVPKKNVKNFERIMKGVSFTNIGLTQTKKELSINGLTKAVRIPLQSLERAYRSTFKDF
ncbi:MAG: AIR synthase-related protein [Minisyncoccia bacterium]